jgi:ferrochelatase
LNTIIIGDENSFHGIFQFNIRMVIVNPFDAVLIVAFGGPQGPDEVRPFLRNVLRGRTVPPERIEAVAHHYELFDGRSPLTELTERQAAGLRNRLRAHGPDLPVYLGMRNWHPYLADTLKEMSDAGVRRAIGFVAATHRSYSGCWQYRLNVDEARRELAASGVPDVEIVYVGDWHTHDGFVAANVERIREARAKLPPDAAAHPRLIFTAHSIPISMADEYPYREQLEESARLIAEQLSWPDWTLVYQSRSGRPGDPWLGPDIGDYLRDARANGLTAAVISPVGFLCDHIEVLYDLDHEAAAVATEVGLRLVRAPAVNDHPAFLDLMADEVRKTWELYASGRPLSLVSTSPPDRIEPPPPARKCR